MVVFLTSSPTGSLDGKYQVDGLDTSNGFVEKLQERWKENSRVLMITAFPDLIEANEQMRDFFEEQTKKMNLSCSCFDLLDYRNKDIDIAAYDVIYLGGGHVPTQNRFFHSIHLKERIKEFDGIVIGISAGSMNSARIVYAQPEESGEAIDPNFQRFLIGLDLCKCQVLPHYQMVKDHYLDGLRLFDDITYGNSYGHHFYAIVDGSYVMIDHGNEVVYGECYLISEGTCTLYCKKGESRKIGEF